MPILKQSTFSVLLSMCALSCAMAPEQTEVENIQSQIMDKGADIIRALNEANTGLLIRDFWESDSALFIIDGMRVQGYDNIDQALSSIPQRRKSLELVADKVDVYVRSPEVAVHVVEFHEKITHLNDSISTGRGIWTATYQLIEDDWKVVSVHESHMRE